jgi:superfamily II DNA or RNA helicase
LTWPSKKTGKPGTTSPFSLFKHQATVLEDIQTERAGGKSAFLVVLPTGTGKTEILIADYAREHKAGRAARALVMVPTRQLRQDHAQKFRNRLPDHGLPAASSSWPPAPCSTKAGIPPGHP